MNDFRVWSDKYNKFMDYKTCAITNDEQIAVFKEGHLSCMFDYDEFQVVYYIGMTDIEGNKIYADSSIVIFNYCHPFRDEKKELIGFFTYSVPDLKYYITVIQDGMEIEHEPNFAVDLKIMGTMQEKPELIKGK